MRINISDLENFLNTLIKDLIEKTIEGKIFWTSKEVSELRNLLKKQEDFLKNLNKDYLEAKTDLFKKIEFLALKNCSKDKIEKIISEDLIRIKKINERIRFLKEKVIRIENKIDIFKYEKEKEWFIKIDDGRYRPDLSFFVCKIFSQRNILEEKLVIFLKLENNSNNKSLFVSSENYSNLYTLSILLKKKERISVDNKVYIITSVKDLFPYL